jgi:hypothetical protein
LEDIIMKSKFHNACVAAAAFGSALAAGVAQSAVPPVDPIGQPAIVVCKLLPSGPVRAVHMDKIIFHIADDLIAANPGDQLQLNAVPKHTPLDIKVLDDPRTVADLKAKVLTFLGAAVTSANRNAIYIRDVDYAVVCPNPEAPGG